MPGIALISPVAFTGAGVASLPIGVPAFPISGATRDFESRVPLGNNGDTVTSWADIAGSGTTLTAAGSTMVGATAPTLLQEPDGSWSVRFTKASSQALGQTLARPNPHTIVSVVRWRANAATLEASVGSGAATGVIQANASNAAMRSFGGSGVEVPVAMGVTWHVMLSVFNTTATISRLDNNTEVTGNAGTGVGAVLSVGGWGTTFSGADFKRVTYLPFAADLTQRNAIVTGLKAIYGI